MSLPQSTDVAFIRGDARRDSRINISDAIAVLSHLFGGRPVACADAADADDNGAVEISDALRIVEYLFVEGEPLAAPFPAAGADPTDDDGLDCRE